MFLTAVDGIVMISPKIVFTHIPKTAGSSFTTGMAALMGGMERIHIVTRDNDDLSDLRPRVDDVVFVGGHIRFPLAFPLFNKAVYLAAIRDPVDRICSDYFFALRQGFLDPSTYKHDLRSGFQRFYNATSGFPGRANHQCRYFADSAIADDSTSVIESHYALVWDSARTDDAWQLAAPIVLNARGGEENEIPALRQAYVAPVSKDGSGSTEGHRPTSYRDFLGSELVERILHEHAEDQMLYSWLVDRDGIYRRC